MRSRYARRMLVINGGSCSFSRSLLSLLEIPALLHDLKFRRGHTLVGETLTSDPCHSLPSEARKEGGADEDESARISSPRISAYGSPWEITGNYGNFPGKMSHIFHAIRDSHAFYRRAERRSRRFRWFPPKVVYALFTS